MYTFAIKPDTYIAFNDEAEQIESCREWGLLSQKATKTKTYVYKRNGIQYSCSMVGYVDNLTAVISFENGELHCIHPSYLKEMQAASFGQRTTADAAPASVTAEPDEVAPAAPAPKVPEAVSTPATAAAEQDKPKAKAKKEKAVKLQLPEEKVKMKATVQEFTTVPNHFSDTDDEVIIYEAVSIIDPPTEVGVAWSSHSATLKKLELQVGDTLTFDAKIAAKKLTKHPVPYKINNPSKIQKEDA